MTRMDPHSIHPPMGGTVRSAWENRSSRPSEPVLTRMTTWAGLFVLGCRHLGQRFGASTLHRGSGPGSTAGQERERPEGGRRSSRIEPEGTASPRTASVQGLSMAGSRIGSARLAGIVGTCFVVGFAGVLAATSDAMHVPGTRTIEAITSRIRLSSRSAEASYVPPSSARTPLRTVSSETVPPSQPARDTAEPAVPGATLPPPPASAPTPGTQHRCASCGA